jgi:hypothetical protein
MNCCLARVASIGLFVAIPQAIFGQAEAVSTWHQAKAPLMTRWAAAVNPTKSHPEYPRPQLVRPEWQNLNGLWDYAVRPAVSGRPEDYDGQILVPFPMESAL